MLSSIIQILTVKTRRCLGLSVGLPACPSLLYNSAFLDNSAFQILMMKTRRCLGLSVGLPACPSLLYSDKDQEVSRSVGRAACMSLFVI